MSAGAECGVKFPPRLLVERIRVYRAVTLVAQHFHESRTSFFQRRLHLAFSHPQEVHLKGFHEEILGVPAIRTRKRQEKTPFPAPPAPPQPLPPPRPP